MKIDVAFNLFLSECRSGKTTRRGLSTLKNYQSALDILKKDFPTVTDIEDVTFSMMLQFVQNGDVKRKWKPNTTNSYLKNLSPFFQWCVQKHLIKQTPIMKTLWRKVPTNVPDFYSESEVEQMGDSIYRTTRKPVAIARNKAILAMFFMIGLRKSELLHLRIDDVDFHESVIRVRGENTKTSKGRAIPIPYALEVVLTDYLRVRDEAGFSSQWFWVSANNGNKLSDEGLKRMFKELSQSVGFNVKAHKMRHTFATKMYEGSLDLVHVQKALGHADIRTTMIYVHSQSPMMRDAVESNPLNKLF